MKYFWFFLAIFFLVPTTAHSSDLTLFAGVQRPGELSLPTGSVPPEVADAFGNPGDFGVFGARLFRSNAPIGFEHTLAYSPNFIDTDTTGFILNSNLLVQVPGLPVRPYATAGFGLVYAGGNGPVSFGTKFAFNYGGGLKVSVLGPLGFRVDMRGYSIRGVEDDSLGVFESSLGVVFGF